MDISTVNKLEYNNVEGTNLKMPTMVEGREDATHDKYVGEECECNILTENKKSASTEYNKAK